MRISYVRAHKMRRNSHKTALEHKAKMELSCSTMENIKALQGPIENTPARVKTAPRARFKSQIFRSARQLSKRGLAIILNAINHKFKYHLRLSRRFFVTYSCYYIFNRYLQTFIKFSMEYLQKFNASWIKFK